MNAVPSVGRGRSLPRGVAPRVRVLLAAAFAFAPGVLAAQDAPAVDRSVKVHAGLYELAAAPQDGSLWVAAVGSSLVPGARLVELDARTLQERSVVDMEAAAGFGLAINHRTRTAYTSNTRAGNMSAIDLRTGEVTIIPNPGDGTPHLYRVQVDEEENMVYASVAQTPGQVWVVDGSTNRVDRVIENVGARPTGLIVDTGRDRLYVANLNDNEIAVIDLTTDRIVDRIPTVGERSTQLAFDPATGRLFVGNQGTNDVSVIDTREGRAVRRVAVGEQPVGVAYHPGTNQIYVANRGSGTVSVVDGETYETVAELEIGTYPNTIYIDESTGMVYVTNKAARSPRGEPATIDPDGDKVTIIRP